MDCSPLKLLCPCNSPGKNTRVGSHSLLQGIFLTQGLNLGLLHCGQILYLLSHQVLYLLETKQVFLVIFTLYLVYTISFTLYNNFLREVLSLFYRGGNEL